jgi:saccharopine dehydrogenase (NAD+, L-lysine-forming)
VHEFFCEDSVKKVPKIFVRDSCVKICHGIFERLTTPRGGGVPYAQQPDSGALVVPPVWVQPGNSGYPRERHRIMNVLLVGTGTVGEAIAHILKGRKWLGKLTLADYSLKRARHVADAVGAGYDVAQVDAGNAQQLKELIAASKADLVLNAVDPRFVPAVFDAALEAGVHYIDMATSLSVPDVKSPYKTLGKTLLGDYQESKKREWESRGKLALIGMGMDPGLSNIFAAYAKKWTFDEVSAIHVRDGGDLRIEGYPFATVFSLWTVIEECLNPPLVWQNGKLEVRAPFSEPEDFVFPEGIGPVMCVNVEHEEVIQLPRTIPADLITFKYALGADFIETLRLLHRLGLDGKNPIDVKGVKVAPRDVIAALSPDPSTLGKSMVGRAVVGTLVAGRKDGRRRETFHYQVVDAAETMGRYKLQPVAWQTGVMPVMAMELIAEGVWGGAGVKSPEMLDPDPFLDLCEDYDVTVKLEHRIPGRSILPATELPPAIAKSVTVKGTSTPTDAAYSAAATAALRTPVDEEQ